MTELLALLIAFTGGCPRDSVLDEYHPAQYARAVHLVDYLGRQQPGMTEFDANRAVIRNVDSVLAYIAPDSLTMTDVTDSSVHRYTTIALRSALHRRSSHAYQTFAHLGYIHRQEPGLTYQALPNGGVLVCVDGWYQLTFVRAREQIYLRRLDSIMAESE